MPQFSNVAAAPLPRLTSAVPCLSQQVGLPWHRNRIVRAGRFPPDRHFQLLRSSTSGLGWLSLVAGARDIATHAGRPRMSRRLLSAGGAKDVGGVGAALLRPGRLRAAARGGGAGGRGVALLPSAPLGGRLEGGQRPGRRHRRGCWCCGGGGGFQLSAAHQRRRWSTALLPGLLLRRRRLPTECRAPEKDMEYGAAADAVLQRRRQRRPAERGTPEEVVEEGDLKPFAT